MGLTSKLFKGDPKLEACLVSDPAHIVPGAFGPHVGKIQFALTAMGLGVIAAQEIEQERYGPSTATAVLGYKTLRQIINRAYQRTPDNIVGKMTIAALDREMAEFEKTQPVPPEPPTPPVEPTSRRFGIRAGTFAGSNLVQVEPPDGDPTTVIVSSAPMCYHVFDIDNMPRIQFDTVHAALYFFEPQGQGVSPQRVPANLYRRLPRIFRLRTPTKLSDLSCSCTYRTLTFEGGRFESFLDLRLPDGMVTVPMFLHMAATPVPAGPVTVSQNGKFAFVQPGL
jgi:hypothetical protein